MFLGAWLFLRKQKRRKQHDLHLLVNKAKTHYDTLRQDNNTSDEQLHQAEHHAREIEKILSHLSSPQHISEAQRTQLNEHTQALEEIAKAGNSKE
tara:strand:- start:10248 stop:10532 length:285 start_codon:yes stop_codon:yes gene_type:complete